MGLTILNGLLMMCLEGNVVCERNTPQPTLKFYEPGKSCYIEGVFYESCPPRKYE